MLCISGDPGCGEPGVSEIEAFIEGEWRAWGVRTPAAEQEAWSRVLEHARILSRAEDGQMVAGAAMTAGALTVPGSEVAVQVLASAWVSPTHRRRGLLRGLMREHLDALRAEGVRVVVLVPAESGIYRSFGFGSACPVATVRLPARAPGFESDRQVRLLSQEAARAPMAAVYESARQTYPGMLSRDAAWWDCTHAEAAAEGEVFFAIHQDGFATYSVKQRWVDNVPDDTIVIHELVANSAPAYKALWRHCLDLDLASRVVAHNRPLEEPLLHLLADARRLRQRPVDLLHVRLLDVEPALAARRYAADTSLVIEVEDEFCPWNSGSYRLESEGCRRTSEPPEISLDAAALGSVYLGGVSVDGLWRAGRVRECAPGAVMRADRVFAWSPRPWLSWSY
jgi:predicted acetyltransferase